MNVAPMPGALPGGQTRDGLLAEVAGQLDGLALGASVVVALSGGPDSTALAYLSAEARPDLDITLVHIAHGLRDAAAEADDLAVVRTHADWLGCDLQVDNVEVARAGQGIEASARDARYAALRTQADACNATAILVGHSADDQAETVLLRLARGTGIDGLAAMQPVSGDLLRPLLRLRRADLRQFVELEGLPVADDATNRSDEVRRVRVREDVLPALERVGPDPVGALTRLADLARDDAATLDAAAAALQAVRMVGRVAVVDAKVTYRDPTLGRRVLRQVLKELTGQWPSADAVHRIFALPDGGAATLEGGMDVEVAGSWITVSPTDAPHMPAEEALTARTDWPAMSLTIETVTPEDTDADGGDEQIAFALPGAWTPPKTPVPPEAIPPGADPARVSLALPSGIDGLQVRAMEPGDRISTAAGTRRLAEVFREAGVPRPLRAYWPVVHADGWVIWVPGICADHDILSAGRTDPAALLRLAPPG